MGWFSKPSMLPLPKLPNELESGSIYTNNLNSNTLPRFKAAKLVNFEVPLLISYKRVQSQIAGDGVLTVTPEGLCRERDETHAGLRRYLSEASARTNWTIQSFSVLSTIT